MSRIIEFTKMHGAGNDYIYVDAMKHELPNPEHLAVEWSRQHTGIGSDGLILIGAATCDGADFSMRIFNNDGSEAMMCGNGARCVAKFLHDKGLTSANPIRLQTLSGIKVLQLHFDDSGEVNAVTVDMGEPVFIQPEQFTSSGETTVCIDGQTFTCSAETTLYADGRAFTGRFISMGNPHFVTFVDDIDTLDIERYGRILERDAAFPQRCNIEMAAPSPKGEGRGEASALRTRVWERGSGVTMACGTGACATAVAAFLAGKSGRKTTIKMDGGDLEIHWREDNHVYLTGPTVTVFEGKVPLQLWH